MKKILTAILALAMVACFAACTKTADSKPDTSEPSTEAVIDGNSAQTPAQIVSGEFKKLAAEKTDPEEIAETMSQLESVPFGCLSMPVEEGLLNGFGNSEIKGFEKGAMFAPMIGAQPYIGYVFALADGTDAASFVKMLNENADLRWNICTSADEIVSETQGGLVMFAMVPASFDMDE